MVGFCAGNFAASLSIWKDHGVNTINFRPISFKGFPIFISMHLVIQKLACHKICMYVAGRPTFISLCAELLIGSATAFMSFLWPTFDEMFPPSNYKGYNESTNKIITHGDIFLPTKFHNVIKVRKIITIIIREVKSTWVKGIPLNPIKRHKRQSWKFKLKPQHALCRWGPP